MVHTQRRGEMVRSTTYSLHFSSTCTNTSKPTAPCRAIKTTTQHVCSSCNIPYGEMGERSMETEYRASQNASQQQATRDSDTHLEGSRCGRLCQKFAREEEVRVVRPRNGKLCKDFNEVASDGARQVRLD